MSDHILYIAIEPGGARSRLMQNDSGRISLQFFLDGKWRFSRWIPQREYEMEFKKAAEEWQKNKSV